MPSCVLLPIAVLLSGVFVDFGLVCAALLCGVRVDLSIVCGVE